MRFIHISDLHIGKRVNEFSMIEDQRYILSQILDIIDENNVECVLIAGDIYDKSVPSIEAVRLFDDFLTGIADRGINVCVISGNHDSPERLSFGARLMKNRGVYVSPVFSGETEPVVFNDKFGRINVYMMPFIKPAVVKHVYPEAGIESYNDAFKYAVSRMEIKENDRNILIAHQFVTGAGRCDSEDISVGGIDNVDSGVFEGFDYVALGHIHGSQCIGKDTVRYCGTPLKYSFSEVNHKKCAVIVDIEEKGNINIKEIPLKPKRNMREIKGSYMEITARDFYEGTDTDDYLHITLTDEEDIPDVIGKLRVIYPNIMTMDYDNNRTRQNHNIEGADSVEAKTPLGLLQEFYQLQNGKPMSEEQSLFADNMINKIWEEKE